MKSSISNQLIKLPQHFPSQIKLIHFQCPSHNNSYILKSNSLEFSSLLQIDEKLYSMSTIEKMKLMFNNYEQDTSINEYVTPIERKEENDFIDAVLQTPVMRFLSQFIYLIGFLIVFVAKNRKSIYNAMFVGMP